ncbi:hypothetical protein BDA96_03G359700 [Sorghum bicolor]|uniref:Uncharacterized protein n=2 Tax=Sorghum bicolor TaxID=4558 RepID=A0A921UPZ0_SORBI|nr:uncharacterized protein LOC8055289 [Sorghum bicolor]EES03789.1 hypothetical protein SORBI_3003G333400 [Sorghum bicolor]KAG0539874.1 hypothetical protein BDA96_03G359700 [Sorghum bicolor]|eukprot:XP_002458669.1 uncharacterized protein LOC8055289 [Sorghum bicolor]
MGEPSADFSAEGVSSSSGLCHSTCLKPGCEHGCACWEDEYVEAVISSGQDDLAVEEIGMALTEVMHANDDEEGPGLDEDSDNDVIDDPILSLESDSTDDLVDVDSVSPAFPSGDGDAMESSIDNSVAGNSSINGTPRLVSAMKGTRAKKGIIAKLSVSWAPDVYDPPITSDSHTVRGHHRSSMKSNYKYKSSKSSSRSTTGSKKDKKHSRHSSSSGGGSKRDRKHSSHSTSSASSSRAVTSGSQYRNTYCGDGISSSRTVTCVPESAKVSPLVLAENAAPQEPVPVLKTLEPIKCATSCSKEKPFALLSRQFSPARYKGMFSFWSQNQLAS